MPFRYLNPLSQVTKVRFCSLHIPAIKIFVLHSLLEFMDFVDEERISYVKIIPTVKPTMNLELDKISLGRIYIMGNIDTYGYSNKFLSRSTTNRILFYEEFYCARLGADMPFLYFLQHKKD